MKDLKLRALALLLGLLLAAPIARATAITAIDDFIITRSPIPGSVATYQGEEIFYRDAFGNGSEPPSGGNFSNGSSGTYAILGVYPSTAESGGKLALDSSLGGPFVNATGGGRTLQRSVLLTDTDVSTDAGLKQNSQTFSVFGLFDLTIPSLIGDGYGILLNDSGPSGGTESVDLFVRREENNSLVIRFQEQDFQNSAIGTIDLDALIIPSGADQIELQLRRTDPLTDAITASYRYWANGAAISGSFTAMSGSADFFTNNGWARGGFFAVEAIQATPEPGTFALVGLGLAGLAAPRRRKQ